MEAQDLTTKMAENLSVRRAFGTAYERDGVLVIPVALVAGGGGAGEGSTAPAGEAPSRAGNGASHDHEPYGSGSGGGFGGLVVPVGTYVVRDGDVRFVPAVNVTLVVLAALATLRVIVRVAGRRRHRHHPG
jgi:uncharacterized spore protein YtfJ